MPATLTMAYFPGHCLFVDQLIVSRRLSKQIKYVPVAFPGFPSLSVTMPVMGVRPVNMCMGQPFMLMVMVV